MREHRVIGPPGTGKTTYLRRQFEQAVQSGKYGPADLYACSLTRAAAYELAARVSNVPDRNIGTLHSHAYRALKFPKIVETTHGLKAWNEWCGVGSWKIGTQHAANPENALPDELAGADTDGVKLMQEMGVLRQRMVPMDAWPLRVQRFGRKWEDFKSEMQMKDFTDLIEDALERIDALEGCRVLFVDEAQDMSKLEFALVRKWGRKCDEFIVVGDPDQNLYEWRGSDPEAFYATDAASERVLEQSYRVPHAVLDVAQRWVEQISNRKPVAYRPTPEHGRTERVGCTYKDPDGLIAHVQKRLDAPRAVVDGETAMVLASCGYMLLPLIARLRELGIPYHNPYRPNFHQWNPLNASRRLLAFLRPDPGTYGGDARTWTFGDLRQWSEVLQSKGTFVRGFKSAVELRCTEDRFRDSQINEPVPFTWLMEQLVDDECREAVFKLDYEWWEHRLRHNDRKAQQFALSVARRHGADRLLQRPRIIVGTIHSVKGGEADHVYVLPDLSSAGYWGSWRTHTKARNAVVRQFYVAMTRARQSLYLLEPSSSMAVDW